MSTNSKIEPVLIFTKTEQTTVRTYNITATYSATQNALAEWQPRQHSYDHIRVATFAPIGKLYRNYAIAGGLRFRATGSQGERTRRVSKA